MANNSLQRIEVPLLDDPRFGKSFTEMVQKIDRNFQKLGSFGLGKGPDGKSTATIPFNLSAVFYQEESSCPNEIKKDYESFQTLTNLQYGDYVNICQDLLVGMVIALQDEFPSQFDDIHRKIDSSKGDCYACWFADYLDEIRKDSVDLNECLKKYPPGRVMVNMSPVMSGPNVGTYEPVGSSAYIYVDPRFRNTDSEITSKLSDSYEDISCVMYVVPTSDSYKFEIVEAFPKMYVLNGELCWKINGLETGIPISGPSGKDGISSTFYIVRRRENVFFNEVNGELTASTRLPGNSNTNWIAEAISNGNLVSSSYPSTTLEQAKINAVVKNAQADTPWAVSGDAKTDCLYQVDEILPFDPDDMFYDSGSDVFLNQNIIDPEQYDNAPCIVLPGEGYPAVNNNSAFWFSAMTLMKIEGGHYKLVVYCPDQAKIDKGIDPYSFANMMMNLDWYNAPTATPGNGPSPRALMIPIGSTRVGGEDYEPERLASHLIYSTTSDASIIDGSNIISQLNTTEIVDNNVTAAKAMTKNIEYAAVVNKRILHIGSTQNWENDNIPLTDSQTMFPKECFRGSKEDTHAELHVDEPLVVTADGFNTASGAWDKWLATVQGNANILGGLLVDSFGKSVLPSNIPDGGKVTVKALNFVEPTGVFGEVVGSFGLSKFDPDSSTNDFSGLYSGIFKEGVQSRFFVTDLGYCVKDSGSDYNFIVNKSGNIYTRGTYVKADTTSDNIWIYHNNWRSLDGGTTTGAVMGDDLLFGTAMATRIEGSSDGSDIFDAGFIHYTKTLDESTANNYQSLPTGYYAEFGFKGKAGDSTRRGDLKNAAPTVIKMAADLISADGGLVVQGLHPMKTGTSTTLRGYNFGAVVNHPLYVKKYDQNPTLTFGGKVFKPAIWTNGDIKTDGKVVADAFVRTDSNINVKKILLDNGDVMSQYPVRLGDASFEWKQGDDGWYLKGGSDGQYFSKPINVEYYLLDGDLEDGYSTGKFTSVLTPITYISNPYMTELYISLPLEKPIETDGKNGTANPRNRTLPMFKNKKMVKGNVDNSSTGVKKAAVPCLKTALQQIIEGQNCKWTGPASNITAYFHAMKRKGDDWMGSDNEQQYGAWFELTPDGQLNAIAWVNPYIDDDINIDATGASTDAGRLKYYTLHFTWCNPLPDMSEVGQPPVPPSAYTVYEYYYYLSDDKEVDRNHTIDICDNESAMPEPTVYQRYLHYYYKQYIVDGDSKQLQTQSEWMMKEFTVKNGTVWTVNKILFDWEKLTYYVVYSPMMWSGKTITDAQLVKLTYAGGENWGSNDLGGLEFVATKYNYDQNKEYYIRYEVDGASSVDDYANAYFNGFIAAEDPNATFESDWKNHIGNSRVGASYDVIWKAMDTAQIMEELKDAEEPAANPGGGTITPTPGEQPEEPDTPDKPAKPTSNDEILKNMVPVSIVFDQTETGGGVGDYKVYLNTYYKGDTTDVRFFSPRAMDLEFEGGGINSTFRFILDGQVDTNKSYEAESHYTEIINTDSIDDFEINISTGVGFWHDGAGNLVKQWSSTSSTTQGYLKEATGRDSGLTCSVGHNKD